MPKKQSQILTLTAGDIKNNKIRFTPCRREFFPEDSFAPCAGPVHGKEIAFVLSGLDKKIKTDMPTDERGTPRWFCRDKTWVKDFIKYHSLKRDSKIMITRNAKREYLLKPIEKFTFIDLFAGIGGIRKAFEHVGGKCVFSSEWDKFACQTYMANHSDMPSDDITKIKASSIPDHDILTAGFPCQPFSIAGVSKKNSLGRKHGFADETQGTLFFDICRIIKEKRPKAFLLENVRNLKSHDKGKTYEVILKNLRDLGYHLNDRVIDGKLVVPQHRERIYIVGTREDVGFEFPTIKEIQRYKLASKLGEILDDVVPEKYTLTDHLWQYLQNYKEKHRKAGNGFGFSLVGREDTTRTLSARYHKDGSEILIKQKGKNPRRLTPPECARLMGFDKPGEKDFQIPVSDTQAYRQFGNSVVVPVVKSIARKLVESVF